MNVSHDMIQDHILDILRLKYDLDISPTKYDENFFGDEIRLNARNLIDLVFDLENKLNVKLTEEQLKSSNILTIKGLTETLFSSLNCV